MLNYIFYGTFLRSLTLPTGNFQTLATYIPQKQVLSSDSTPIDQLIKYVRYLQQQKGHSETCFKQYYRLDWLKEINTDITETEKNQLFMILDEILISTKSYKKDIWNIDILSARVFNMLSCSHYLFDKNHTSTLAKEYFKNILQQAIFLRRKLRKYAIKRDYILYVIRSLYACICFLEERNQLKSLLSQLAKKLSEDFYKDGGHMSRNASFQLKIIDELITLRDLAVNSGIALPNNMQSAISLSVDYLNFLRHPDGKLAIFNGSYESDTTYINNTLRTSLDEAKKSKLIKLKDSGFYRLNAPNMTLITDLQEYKVRHQYDYTSMLAFELSIGASRVFINCGSGDTLGKKWVTALQQPAAHTMPIIDITDIKPSLKKPVIIGKKTLKSFVVKNSQGTTLEAAQSYEFGKTGHFTHHRHLTLFKTGKVLRGEDIFHLVQNDKKSPVNEPHCFIRFHLGINIEAKSSGTSVILKVPNQGEWMFTVGSGKIIMEPSIYLGTASLINTKQIVIKLKLNKPQVKFRWTLQELTKTSQNIAHEKNTEDLMDA